jgi:HK97 family phage major capsid protein
VNFDQLIRKLESDASAVHSRWVSKSQHLVTLRAQAAASTDPNEVRALAEKIEQVNAELADLNDKTATARQDLANARAERAHDDELTARANTIIHTETAPDEESRSMSTIRVSSPQTYSAEAARAGDGPSFLRDLYRSQIAGDPAASERLARHGEEVRVEQPHVYERAVNAGGVGAFVPPQYLGELWAEYARAGRPVADLCNRGIPLPEQGMTVNIPRVTTASTAAVQASENSAVSNTDLDETTLAVPVVTIAGFTDLSRQAIERGELVEAMAFADLAAAYNTALDAQVINGSGSSGQHLGVLNVGSINTVTYTDGTPTVAELWPKLADAVGRIQGSRYTGATAIVMRPNVWAWLLSEKDTTGRPLINAGESGVMNGTGVVDAQEYGGVVGRILGTPVVLSGNVPNNLGAGTNETRIVVADFRDLFLMEQQGGGPVQLRFEQPLSNSLGVRLLAYGYSAFASARQPSAISVVAGTGLIVPAL